MGGYWAKQSLTISDQYAPPGLVSDPTQSGGNHGGDLIWSEMVKLCFAQ